MLVLPEVKRDLFFDLLRKQYPVRREFQNTVVKVPAAGELAEKLAGIGFQVKTERKQ